VTDETAGETDEPEEAANGDAWITDLVAAVVLALTVYVVSTVGGADSIITSIPLVSSILSAIRAVLGLFVALFVPGYVIFALFDPRLADREGSRRPYSKTWLTVPRFEPKLTVREGFGWGERAVVSFLLSVVFLVVQGLLLAVLSRGFGARAVIQFTSFFILVVALLAGARRMRHYSGSVELAVGWLSALVEQNRNPPTRLDAGLNLLLAVLLLVGAVVVVAPSVGEKNPQFTEFALLTENDSGDLVAAGISSILRSNGSDRVIVDIVNRERTTRQYTLVAQVQRAVVGERSIRVLNRQRIDRYQTTLSHNETETVPYRFNTSPGDSGCRVVFLLYIEDVPRTPTIENAYRELHIWDGQPPSTREEACPSLDAIELASNDSLPLA